MGTVTLERSFKADRTKVFDYVSRTEHILKWWGPETGTIPEHNIAFDKIGPWMVVIRNAEGKLFKVSGHVTHVDPPTSIGFTWGWHDDDDVRGHESHVTIRLDTGPQGGTNLTLTHVDLTEEQATTHEEGWTHLMGRLEALLHAN